MNRHFLFISSLGICLLSVFSCLSGFVKNKEAREDVIEYENAMKANSRVERRVTVDLETEPVHVDHVDVDAADDPAFWYNHTSPARSVVFGSNKKGGIHRYSVDGLELSFHPVGEINNIDVRQGLSWDEGVHMDIIGGSRRDDNSLVFFTIDSNGHIGDAPDFAIDLGEFEPYGFCLGVDSAQRLLALVNDKNGEIKVFVVFCGDEGWGYNYEGSYWVGTQPEGMVHDDVTGMLYVGEEQAGIHWFLQSEIQTSGDKPNISRTMIKGSSDQNPWIRYDIEGLSIIRHGGQTYLLASIQGAFAYAIFSLEGEPRFLFCFTLDENANVDAVEETDGLDVVQHSLGEQFPEGMLIVQDGFNYDADTLQKQNFKYADLQKILRLL